MKDVLHTLTVEKQNRFCNGEELPIGHQTLTRINIIAGTITHDRISRLKMFGDLFGIPNLVTTRQLTAAQGMAFIALAYNSDNDRFINYLHQNYGGSNVQPTDQKI